MSKKKRTGERVRTLTSLAMLAALSAVIGIICKNFLTFNVYYRITFENLPIICAGLIFGPFAGAACGVCADIVSCLCSTNPALNPLITVGAALVGLCAGAVPRFIIKKRCAAQYALAVAGAHLIGQVTVKSIAKIIWFGMPWWATFVGLGISVFVGTVEFFIIRYLFDNKIIGVLNGEKHEH